MTIPIVEIFNSIEGEGKRAGRLCTFIRTAGCNLRCSFCDTPYSYNESEAVQMDIDEIIQQVGLYDCDLITLTGGEPLLHDEVREQLIPALLQRGYQVNIETNGSISLAGLREMILPEDISSESLFFTMDWKCVSSHMNSKMLHENLAVLKSFDVLKFVVGSNVDLLEMYDILQSHKIKAQPYVSPVFGKIEMEQIVDFMKTKSLKDVKLQCQLHKIVYEPNRRGV